MFYLRTKSRNSWVNSTTKLKPTKTRSGSQMVSGWQTENSEKRCSKLELTPGIHGPTHLVELTPLIHKQTLQQHQSTDKNQYKKMSTTRANSTRRVDPSINQVDSRMIILRRIERCILKLWITSQLLKSQANSWRTRVNSNFWQHNN